MPAPRRTRQDKRDATRAQILVAAREVFGKHGYHGATIETIARRADLSNGAVYYNFANKEDLFLALLDDRLDDRLERLQRVFGRAGSGEATAEQVEHEAAGILESLKESSEWRLLFLEFVIYAARNPAFRERFIKRRARFKAALCELLERHAQAGTINPPMPVDDLAVLLTALVNGLAVEELAEPGAVPDGLLASVLEMMARPATT